MFIGKSSVFKVGYYLWFQAPTGSLGTCPPLRNGVLYFILISGKYWPYNVNWEVFCSVFWQRWCKIGVIFFKCLVKFATKIIRVWSFHFIEVVISSRWVLSRSPSSSSLCVHPCPWGAIQNNTTSVLIWVDAMSMCNAWINLRDIKESWSVERLVTLLKG